MVPKMKVTWQEEDIITGRRYGKPGCNETWAIGYLSWVNINQAYVSISNQDGMVSEATSKQGLAEYLNKFGYLPIELI